MDESPWRAQEDGRALSWQEVDPGASDVLGWTIAVLRLIFAPLELCFAMFSVLSAAVLLLLWMQPNPPPELAPSIELFGLFALAYVVLGLGGLIGAIGHLIAGVQLLLRRPSRPLLWLSVATTVGSLITFYCSVFGILSAILTLLWLTRPVAPPAPAES